jgi:hypothetical protein
MTEKGLFLRMSGILSLCCHQDCIS